MEERSEGLCVAGRGIEGDRYFLGAGTYSPKPDVQEVTLIEQEALDALNRNDPPLQEGPLRLLPVDHRRNLTVRGVPLLIDAPSRPAHRRTVPWRLSPRPRRGRRPAGRRVLGTSTGARAAASPRAFVPFCWLCAERAEKASRSLPNRRQLHRGSKHPSLHRWYRAATAAPCGKSFRSSRARSRTVPFLLNSADRTDPPNPEFPGGTRLAIAASHNICASAHIWRVAEIGFALSFRRLYRCV